MYSTLQDAIKAYLNRGFGSMNKNDFEVFIFNELLHNSSYKGYMDYDFSVMLRIPETKVKRLRYEASLKYPQDQNEAEWRQAIDTALQHARIIPNAFRCIEIGIEDVMLRKSVESKLKKANKYTDFATNSEILKLTLEDYETLLKEVYGEEAVEQTLQKVLKELEKKSGKKEKRTFKDLLKKLFEGMADGVGHWVIDLALAALPELLKTL